MQLLFARLFVAQPLFKPVGKAVRDGGKIRQTIKCKGFRIDFSEQGLQGLQPLEPIERLARTATLGLQALQLRLQLCRFGKKLLPVAGFQLVVLLGLAGILIAVEGLVKAAILRASGRIDAVGLPFQRLAQA